MMMFLKTFVSLHEDSGKRVQTTNISNNVKSVTICTVTLHQWHKHAKSSLMTPISRHAC